LPMPQLMFSEHAFVYLIGTKSQIIGDPLKAVTLGLTDRPHKTVIRPRIYLMFFVSRVAFLIRWICRLP
jgi:hypothetical protein